MRRFLRTFSTLLLIALLALPALAQEAEVAATESPRGLGPLMLILGVGVVAFIGIRLAQREASGDENDLV